MKKMAYLFSFYLFISTTSSADNDDSVLDDTMKKMAIRFSDAQVAKERVVKKVTLNRGHDIGEQKVVRGRRSCVDESRG